MTEAATKLITRQPPGLLITERDLDILQSLATARFLTSLAIEWLHFPERQQYWADHLAAQDFAAPRPVAYRLSSAVHLRIQLLHRHGYLHRVTQPMARTGHVGGREPDVLMLAAPGAQLLMDAREVSEAEVAWYRQRKRSTYRTAHAVAIGLVYAALRTKIATMQGVRMVGWQGEHQTVQHYDQVQIQRRTASGSMESVSVGIQPDATFDLHHRGGNERIFIEVDRGTRALETWRQKMLAYRAYMGSPALQQRYGTDRFILLTIAPTPTQLHQLMRVTGEVIGTSSNRHLFCLESAVHPLTIGAAWHKLAAVRQVEKARNGTPYQVTEIDMTPHTLLQ